MLLEQIKNFEIFRPKCDPSKEILHGLATFDTDISPVFPYLNAELGGWDYDGDESGAAAQALRRQGVYPAAARDRRQRRPGYEESHAMLAWIKGQINDIYERREEITPRYTGQAGT